MSRLHFWLYTLVLAVTSTSLEATNFSSLGFKILYDGGTKITASYSLQADSSIISCGAICQQTSKCWVFTWDTQTKECQLMNEITSLIKTESAASTLRTYYASNVDAKNIVITASNCAWLTCKSECVAKGGRLFLPVDTTYALVLTHVFGHEQMWVGMYRQSSTTWYDMDEKQATKFPTWLTNQPNDFGGNQDYIVLEKGYINDIKNGDKYYGICEVPH